MAKSSIRTVDVPDGVEVAIGTNLVTIKGKQGSAELELKHGVSVVQDNGSLEVTSRSSGRSDLAIAGTIQALLRNMVHGVTELWERKLELQGTGFRARMDGGKLNLLLGYSNPIEYEIPEGVVVETPTQTEVVVTGIDRQRVGQVAANIRRFRPPEPYKGKGVRFADEHVRRKEGKKK